jgi:hypothetical protein
MLSAYSSDIVAVFFTAVFYLPALGAALSCLLAMVIIYGTVLSPRYLVLFGLTVLLRQSFQFRNIILLIVVIIFLLDSEYLVLDGKESIHYIRIKMASPPFSDNDQ